MDSNIQPNLECFNTIKGLRISWDDLSSEVGFIKYRLLRKKYGYSVAETDGIIVCEGVNNFVLDEDVENGALYYYTLYVIKNISAEEVYMTGSKFRMSTITHVLGDSADKMYNSLPDIYINEDAKVSEVNKMPLYRFLKLIGYQYDKIENYINNIFYNIDIDNCDVRYLPMIAKFLGIRYDWSLTASDNRALIKIMVDSYDKKGTYDGLKTILQNISKSEVDITIDKTPVLRTGTSEEITQRRTVKIDVYLSGTNSSWIKSRTDKLVTIIYQNVPKKNLKYVVLNVNVVDYSGLYEDIYDFNKAKENIEKLLYNIFENVELYLRSNYKEADFKEGYNIVENKDGYKQAYNNFYYDSSIGLALRGYDTIGYATQYGNCIIGDEATLDNYNDVSTNVIKDVNTSVEEKIYY